MALALACLGPRATVVAAQDEDSVAPAADQPAEDDAYAVAVRSALEELAAGRLIEARAYFLQAHELAPSARTLRGLGLVAFELGHYVEAADLLQRALTSTARPLTPALREQVVELRERAHGFIGRYVLERSPPEASARVDGREVPGSEIALDPGEHTVVVQAEGYVAVRRRVDVSGGERRRLRFELAPEPRIVATSPAPVDDEQSVLESPWLWVAVAAAAVAAAVVAVGVAVYDPGVAGAFDGEDVSGVHSFGLVAW